MRKDYEMDEENLQEAEDEFYNYYHGEKKKTNKIGRASCRERV